MVYEYQLFVKLEARGIGRRVHCLRYSIGITIVNRLVGHDRPAKVRGLINVWNVDLNLGTKVCFPLGRRQGRKPSSVLLQASNGSNSNNSKMLEMAETHAKLPDSFGR